MGGHKTFSCSTPRISPPVIIPPIPPLVPDYVVTPYPGELPIPDPSGNYFEEGIHNGFPYYKCDTKNYYLFRFALPLPIWFIGAVLGPISDGWGNDEENIDTSYYDEGDVSGWVDVTLGS